MNLDRMLEGQDKELKKVAKIYSNDKSIAKKRFPEDKQFKFKDILKLIFNIKIVAPTLLSVFRSPKIIKQHTEKLIKKDTINDIDFNRLDNLIREELGMDTWGITKLESSDVFKDKGIPYETVIVMSKNMNENKFVLNQLPNMDCQIEVMKIYGETGKASLKVTEFLRSLGFGAVPNHSLGGSIDYTKAAYKANLGYIGRHGMLITPENGPCNRISVVYTNIKNIKDYLKNDLDYTWGLDFCKSCGKCIRNCPENAIYDKPIIDENGNVTCIDNIKCNSGFKNYGCAKCIAACPFTNVGYNKLYNIYKKNI